MTDIQFHFNVPDRLLYACRLLRKASRAVDRIVVAAPAATLARLDRMLWTFDPIEFIAHIVVKPGQAPQPRVARTPVWLVESCDDAGDDGVLVNLGDETPRGFERFSRLIEIVSGDAVEREAARARWKQYAARGYDIKRHEVTA